MDKTLLVLFNISLRKCPKFTLTDVEYSLIIANNSQSVTEIFGAEEIRSSFTILTVTKNSI